MRPVLARALCLTALGLALVSGPASAFCGFFVGKADAKLFNRASQVALVRNGDRTVLTMSNDYQGEASDFALVVPVPTVLQKDQIHIGDRKLLERLDSYSSPRLVEYTDPNPCEVVHRRMKMSEAPASMDMQSAGVGGARAQALGVKVEAQYTVGEYDIVLLSATQSNGLETWLLESGYKIPPTSAAALAPYVRQEMKFFVAKVNLKERAKAGFQELRPIQIAYESPRFMLPIRLGMANADGPQDLIVYALTQGGRVESTNYRTVKVPSNMDVPEFVQSEFGPFYKATFAKALERESRRAVFTEYFWDMGWCDPCAADPLAPEELQQLGVYWLDQGGQGPTSPRGRRRPRGGTPVVLTRLHVRYDAEHFPEDLMFQETGDRQNFQARYVVRHQAAGDLSCDQAKVYQVGLSTRREKEARTLAELTGWSLESIQQKMPAAALPEAPAERWWQRLWK